MDASRTTRTASCATAATALPPLAALDGAQDRVLSLSTLSKIAAPGLRIGWVRAPAALRHPLTIAKQAADLHSSTVDQAAAARWLETVDLDERIGALRAAYGARRDALVDGLAAALPPGSTHNHPDGGMFVWARLPDGWDAAALLERALARDVAFVPGFPFFAGPPDAATLRLSFTTHSAGRDRRGPAPAARRLGVNQPATGAWSPHSVFSSPAQRPGAAGPRQRAVRAADRGVALVVQRVVREVVLGDVRPHVLLGPGGQRVGLPQPVAAVPGELGRAGPVGRLVAADAGDPAVGALERALERLDLAQEAAAVGIRGPEAVDPLARGRPRP